MTRVFTKSECDNKGNKCDDTIGPKRKNVLPALLHWPLGSLVFQRTVYMSFNVLQNMMN